MNSSQRVQEHPSMLLRIPEACELLGLSRSMIYALIDRGVIVPIRIGRCVRIRRLDLMAFVEGLGGARAEEQ